MNLFNIKAKPKEARGIIVDFSKTNHSSPKTTTGKRPPGLFCFSSIKSWKLILEIIIGARMSLINGVIGEPA